MSDFDASLELSTEGYLLPDPPKSTSKDFYVTTDRTYHISSVGTIGFKSPEGSMYSISNSSDLMTEMTTKADIFRCKFCTIFCLLWHLLLFFVVLGCFRYSCYWMKKGLNIWIKLVCLLWWRWGFRAESATVLVPYCSSLLCTILLLCRLVHYYSQFISQVAHFNH